MITFPEAIKALAVEEVVGLRVLKSAAILAPWLSHSVVVLYSAAVLIPLVDASLLFWLEN